MGSLDWFLNYIIRIIHNIRLFHGFILQATKTGDQSNIISIDKQLYELNSVGDPGRNST